MRLSRSGPKIFPATALLLFFAFAGVNASAQVATFQVLNAPLFVCSGATTFIVGAITLNTVSAGTITAGTKITFFYGSAVNPGSVISGTGASVITSSNPGVILELTYTANQAYALGDRLTVSDVPVVRSSSLAVGQDLVASVGASPPAAVLFISPTSVFVATGVQCTISAVSGSSQSAVVASPLANPFVVKLTPCGVQGVAVNFAVTSGGGSVSPSQAIFSSFPTCEASTTLTLGTIAGVQTVTASSPLTNSVSFTAVATAGPPAAISIFGGNNQTGKVNTSVGSLGVRSSDQFGNSAGAATITFAVTAGGGSVSPTQATTDLLGLAFTTLTLGPLPGVNTVTASSPGLAGSPLTFTATATQSQPMPSISEGGLVNAVSRLPSTEPGGKLAPGAIVAIEGSDLAAATMFASNLPLPTQLGDTSVTFSDVETPLFLVSPARILAQVPSAVPGNESTVSVRRGDGPSAQRAVMLALASPGIFTLDGTGQGPGLILHTETFQLVNENNRIRPGEGITLLCTGLGPVQGEVSSGAPGPSPALETVGTPLVTISDLPAEVTFSGLAAGLVGIYRVDATVPAGVPAGTQNVQIRMADIPSNVVSVAVGPAP